MRKFITEHVLNEKFSLRERIFRLIIMVGFAVSIVAIAVSFGIDNFYETLLPLLVMFVSMVVGILLTFRYNKLDVAAILVAISVSLCLYGKA